MTLDTGHLTLTANKDLGENFKTNAYYLFGR
jgi:hypothetical protein